MYLVVFRLERFLVPTDKVKKCKNKQSYEITIYDSENIDKNKTLLFLLHALI